MNALSRIARSARVGLVEDVAQAIGAEFHGRRAGSIGDIGCISFYPTKNLGGAGDGGMLTTQSDQLADRLRLLRGHGMRPRYYHSVVGHQQPARLVPGGGVERQAAAPRPLDDHAARQRRPLHRAVSRGGLGQILGLPAARPTAGTFGTSM